MSAIPQPNGGRIVSERILDPLRQVARRQWIVLAAQGLLQTLLLGLGLLLVVALLFGFFIAMPLVIRLLLAALCWAGIVVGAVYFLRPALRRRSLANAAFTIEQQMPDLQERISSAVELSEEDPVFAGSRQMIYHLVNQAEADAQRVNAEAIIPASAITKWAIYLLPVLVLWLLLALLMPPERLLGGMYRLLMPWRNTLPAALANIGVEPGDVTLAEGDSLDVKVRVNHLSGPDRDSKNAQLVIRYGTSGQGQPMELLAAGPREFRAHLDDVRQSFSYMAKTDRGESVWYTATVNPRPSVAQLDLRYEYPTYTQLEPKEVKSSRDGAIDALQRTEVKLTLHTSSPIDIEKSKVTVYEGDRQRTLQINPVAGAERAYTATINVAASGSYQIDLVNPFGLANKDNQRRPITCTFDKAPAITIKSPEPKINVRADDEVPVLFEASDDFAVAKVRAMVQVDTEPPKGYDVALPSARRSTDGKYVLSVAANLAKAQNGRGAQQIIYWLEATDNRDPDPQNATTDKQTLVIERNKSQSYAEVRNAKLAKDLMEAVEKAIRRLDQARGPVDASRNVDENRALQKEELSRATSTRDLLALTSKDLGDAASEHLADGYAKVAQEAKDVAEGPIVGAAETTAKMILTASAADKNRRPTGELALKQIDEAKQRLEALRKKIEEQKAALETAEKLRQLALAQQDLAKQQDALHEQQEKAQEQANADHKLTPQEQAQLNKLQEQQNKQRERQQQLINKLQEQIARDERLRTPEAVEAARRLGDLQQRLAEQQEQTSRQQEQTAKQQDVAKLQEQANELAKQQQALNDDLKKFQQQQAETLQEANAQTPNQEQQQNIVNELQQNHTQNAAQQQRQSADQLKNAAKQLQQQATSKDLKPSPAEQKKLDLVRAEAQQDQNLANQVAQAQQKAQEAVQNATANAKDQNAQQAADKAQAQADAAADQLLAEAKEAQAEAADAGKQADAAAQVADQAAQAAKTDAQRHDAAAEQASAKEAQKAAQAAAKAADQALAQAEAANQAQDQAAKAQDQAQQAAQNGDQQAAQKAQQEAQKATEQAAQAAQKAGEQLAQADQQIAAAQQDAQLADQQADAAQAATEAQNLANRQQALAEAAANKAEELAAAQQNQASAQDIANRENQLADQARQAAQAAQQLAEQAKATNPALAERAADALPQIAKAAEAQAEAAKAEQQAAQAQERAQQAGQQAAQAASQAAQRGNEAAQREQQAAAANDQAQAAQEQAAASKEQAGEQHAVGNDAGEQAATQQGQQATDQAKAAQQQAGQLGEQAKNAQQQAAQATQQAQAAQAQAQQAEAQAAQAADQAARAQANAEQALAEAQQILRGLDAAVAEAGNHKSEGNHAQDEHQQAQGEQGEPQQSAAQAAQEAAQAQQQAAQGEKGAGQEAANALAQAAQAAADAAENGQPGEAQAQGQAQQPATTPGKVLDSQAGISVVDGAGGAEGVPQQVKMLGISASDWVKLGPAMQQDLLNAAQQNGPPSYQEMIKNYYVRIARMNGKTGNSGK